MSKQGEAGRWAGKGKAFRAGERAAQRYAIRAQGKRIALRAQGNLWDGRGAGFVANPEALAAPGSLLTENERFNPVGLLGGAPPFDRLRAGSAGAPRVPASGQFVANTHPHPVAGARLFRQGVRDREARRYGRNGHSRLAEWLGLASAGRGHRSEVFRAAAVVVVRHVGAYGRTPLPSMPGMALSPHYSCHSERSKAK